MNKLLYLLLIAVCWSCSQDSETEKHQSKRDQVVDVRDKMKEFSTQDVLIGRISRTYLIDNYINVTDYNSPDKLIHLFDKNTFEHLASSTYQGQGPDEITIIGHVGIDETNRRRSVQMAYNAEHGITPQTIVKAVRDIIEIGRKEESGKRPTHRLTDGEAAAAALTPEELGTLIEELTSEMKTAAAAHDFERAAYLRERIASIQKDAAAGDGGNSSVSGGGSAVSSRPYGKRRERGRYPKK